MNCKISEFNSSTYDKLLELTGSQGLSARLELQTRTNEFQDWLGATTVNLNDDGSVTNSNGESRFLIDLVSNEDKLSELDTNISYGTKPKNTSLVQSTTLLPSGKEAYNKKLSDTEKSISNKYFRYTNTDGTSLPYSNYDTGSPKTNKDLVSTINSNFDKPVVTYNTTTNTIEFTNEATYSTNIELTPEDSVGNKVQATKSNDAQFIDDYSYSKDDKFMELINKLENVKTLLSRDLTEIKGTDREDISKKRAELKKKISSIESQIATITKSEDADPIVLRMGLSQVNTIRTKLVDINNTNFKDLADEDLLSVMRDVQELGFYLKAWKDTNKLLPNSTDPNVEVLSGKVKTVHDNMYTETFKELFLEYTSRKSKVVRKSSLNEGVDETTWRANMFGANMSGDELIWVTDDIIDQAVHDANTKYAEKEVQIKQKIEELKSNYPELDEKELYGKLYQESQEGEKTGRFVSKTKPEYYWERDSLFNKAKSFKKTDKGYKAAWKAYKDFISKNSDAITRKEAESGNSKAFTKEEHREQTKMLKEFDEFRKLKEADLKEEFSDSDGNMVDIARFNSELEKFDNQFSPYTYWDTKGKSGSKSYILYNKPKPKWDDSRFKSIQDDPKMKEFYKWMLGVLKENTTYIPNLYETGTTYMPELNKTLGERFADDGVLGVIKNVPTSMNETLMERSDSLVDSTVRIENTEMKSVPVRGRSGMLNVNKRSFDLEAILLSDTKQSLSYKYRDDIKVVAQAAQEFMSDRKRNTAVDGKKQVTRFGITVSLGSTMDNSKKMLEYAIDAKLFDQRRKSKEFQLGKEKLTKDDKDYLKELEIEPSEKGITERKEHLKELRESNQITKKEYNSEIAKLDSLGSKYTGGAIGDQVIRYTYLKALALPNFVSPIINFMMGTTANMMIASGGEFYSGKDLAKATKLMLTNSTLSKAKKSEVEKIYAFMRSLGVLGQQDESLYDRNKTWTDKLTILQESTEKFVQGQSMVATLMSEKTGALYDKNKNKVTVWEAYTTKDGVLVWDTDKMGKELPKSNKSVEGGRVNLYRLGKKINKIIALGGHGDYVSPLRVKKSVSGRVLMLFRTWMPSAVEARFGKLAYDYDLETSRKGRLRSLWNIQDQKGDTIGGFKELLSLISKGKFTELSKVDQANIRKDIAELVFIATTVSLVWMLRSIDTDDEDEKQYLNLLLNTSNRLVNDLSFFYSPESSVKFFDNAVPIYNTVSDLVGVVSAGIDTVTGDPLYKGGMYSNESRLLHSMLKATPVLSGYRKLEGLADRVYN